MTRCDQIKVGVLDHFFRGFFVMLVFLREKKVALMRIFLRLSFFIVGGGREGEEKKRMHLNLSG